MDLCNIDLMKAVLAKHGFHFSKAKGQNFLTQRWVVEQIADAAGLNGDTQVLEVGPGIGCLTKELCLRAGRVCAVEVDTSLKPVLAETLGEFQNLDLIYGDVLKLDLAQLVAERLPGGKPVACANLPYYITSPILTALLASRLFSSVTVMVQREVAQRICAPAGSGDYSAFSIFCQYYAAPSLLFSVPPHCFIPQPKVTSAVVRLDVRDAPPCELLSEACFFRTVRAGFAMRRKTALNALAAGYSKLGKAGVAAALEEAGLAPSARCETFTIAQFARLSDALYRREQDV